MAYAVWTLSHAQHHRVVCQIKGQRHEIERVRAEPRLADEKSPAHLAAVIIEVNLPAVCPARQPSPRHFYLRRGARCDVRHKCTQSPKPQGHEASRRFDALGFPSCTLVPFVVKPYGPPSSCEQGRPPVYWWYPKVRPYDNPGILSATGCSRRAVRSASPPLLQSLERGRIVA